MNKVSFVSPALKEITLYNRSFDLLHSRLRLLHQLEQLTSSPSALINIGKQLRRWMPIMIQHWVYWAGTGFLTIIVIALLVLNPIIDAYHRRKIERESAERTFRDRY